MAGALYAVVSYISGELGTFIDQLRAELVPAQAHLRAHITLLPPRPLLGTLEDASRTLARLSSQPKPITVSFGEVRLFLPISPTVYLSIEQGAEQVQAMHDALNTGEFFCYEALPYIPHLTVASLASDDEAQRAAQLVRRRWAEYKGARSARLTELTFAVDPELGNQWDDLATFPLTG
ncbi:MAG: 2'-5' RNA ligase family protein [Acidobacteriales bacterium]|nr:2'-5' RNA ligase family protein [Terriglobales bacterium]